MSSPCGVLSCGRCRRRCRRLVLRLWSRIQCVWTRPQAWGSELSAFFGNFRPVILGTVFELGAIFVNLLKISGTFFELGAAFRDLVRSGTLFELQAVCKNLRPETSGTIVELDAVFGNIVLVTIRNLEVLGSNARSRLRDVWVACGSSAVALAIHAAYPPAVAFAIHAAWLAAVACAISAVASWIGVVVQQWRAWSTLWLAGLIRGQLAV